MVKESVGKVWKARLREGQLSDLILISVVAIFTPIRNSHNEGTPKEGRKERLKKGRWLKKGRKKEGRKEEVKRKEGRKEGVKKEREGGEIEKGRKERFKKNKEGRKEGRTTQPSDQSDTEKVTAQQGISSSTEAPLCSLTAPINILTLTAQRTSPRLYFYRHLMKECERERRKSLEAKEEGRKEGRKEGDGRVGGRKERKNEKREGRKEKGRKEEEKKVGGRKERKRKGKKGRRKKRKKERKKEKMRKGKEKRERTKGRKRRRKSIPADLADLRIGTLVPLMSIILGQGSQETNLPLSPFPVTWVASQGNRVELGTRNALGKPHLHSIFSLKDDLQKSRADPSLRSKKEEEWRCGFTNAFNLFVLAKLSRRHALVPCGFSPLVAIQWLHPKPIKVHIW
ncbi:Garp, partial [Ophiophagus hannah]